MSPFKNPALLLSTDATTTIQDAVDRGGADTCGFSYLGSG
jgi:hypothetical protein